MLNPHTSYLAYAAGFESTGAKIAYLIMFVLGIYVVVSQYLRSKRYDRVVKQEHHSLEYFENVTEADRKRNLRRDLKEIF